MRGLGGYIAAGSIVVLGLAAVVLWTPRQVSVLIDARSEFVEFGHGADQEPLTFRFVGATVCDDARHVDAPSPHCPGYRALGEDRSGALVVRGPAWLRIERRSQGRMRLVVTPQHQRGLRDDAGEPSAAEFVADAAPDLGNLDRFAAVEPIALQGVATVTVATQVEQPAHWFAADAARRLHLGALVVVGAEAGAPALLEGEVTMRGRSVYRVLADRVRGRVADLAETRFLLELGGERLRLGEVVRLCAAADCARDAQTPPPAMPEAVLRARPHPDGGLAVMVRALAAGVEARSVGSQARLIAPSVFDRLTDPAFAWMGVLATVFTTLSLFAHRWREAIFGKLRNALRILFRRVFKRAQRRPAPAKRPAKQIAYRRRKHG